MKKIILIMISAFFMTAAHAEFDLQEIFGNQEVGSSCESDYQCETLCCDASKSCAPHSPNSNQPVYCNKEAGERCIASEFCKGEYVTTCRIVKSGTSANGSVSCSMRCQPIYTRGDCVSTYCKSPRIPAVPSWDGVDCSNAVDP